MLVCCFVVLTDCEWHMCVLCRLTLLVHFMGGQPVFEWDRLEHGSPNFFVRGPHTPLHTCSRAGLLTSCYCFGKGCIPPNHKFLVNMLFFHHWQNGFAGRICPAGRSLETPALENSLIIRDWPAVNKVTNTNWVSHVQLKCTIAWISDSQTEGWRRQGVCYA